MKSTVAPLAAFGLLLASVCNAKLDIKPNDRERILKSNRPSQPFDRSYIKTPDGRKEPRQVEPISVVTTITPEGRTLQQATGTISCRLWRTCITYFDEEVDESARDSERWDCTFDDLGLDNGEYASTPQKHLVAAGEGDLDEFLKLNGGVSGSSVAVISRATFTDGKMAVEFNDFLAIEDYAEKNIVNDPGDRGVTVGGGSRDAQPTQPPKPLRGLPENPRRKLATGEKVTLVVRVSTNDNSVTAPATDLSKDVFDDEYCLKSQYDSCSFGQLKIQEYIKGTTPTKSPTSLTTAPNAPGVMELNVDIDSQGKTKEEVGNAARAKLEEVLGTNPGNVFDLVLFCMPPGTGNWIAYAVINRWDSFYNDDWCSAVSSQMHEVGHNIGLHHSGEYEGSSSVQEYGDQTDMMGYSYRSDDTPAMCFNPAKNYQLGWYLDKQIDLDPSKDLSTEYTSYILNGFVDYADETDDRYIVIRIGKFYIGFNKATDFNSGVQEAPNQVTIIEKLGEPTESEMSKLAAKLSIGDEYTFELSELLSVSVVYQSNDAVNGKDAVVGIAVVGDAVSCPGEYDAEVTVEFISDNYPSENSLSIEDPLGLTLFFKGTGEYTVPGTYIETVGGLCRGLEYTFIIKDTYNDGICCSWGEGSFAVKYKGEVILSGGEFGDEDVIKFTLPEDEISTLEPTDSPVSSPTLSPTNPPTSFPTSSPTDPPTSFPTSSPTDSPTSFPTSSPTDSPTSFPTSSPTASPTTSPEWLYRGKEGKNCAWVAKGNDRQTRIKCLRRAAVDPLIAGDVWLFCTEICCAAGINQACEIL